MTALPPRPNLLPALRREPAASWATTAIKDPFGLWSPEMRVAVLIPCHNEAEAIAAVIGDFRRFLPDAVIYVYDNNSTDDTIAQAYAAGAIVRCERLQGKGHVVRRMFADIEADAYVLVDGDGTYDASVAPEMLRLLVKRQLDMVSAARLTTGDHGHRFGHHFGNVALSKLVFWAFGAGITDLLSGYRVFSRRFVKSFPALSSGFETETEFTVHALALHMPMQEIRAPYRGRIAGARSKLNTITDGIRILREIVTLIQHERPLQVFSLVAAVLLAFGVALGLPVVSEFLHTGLVPRLPTALLATGLVLLACLSLTCGLILDAIARGRKELKRLAYLNIPPVETAV